MLNLSFKGLRAALLFSTCLLTNGAMAQTTTNSRPGDATAETLPNRLVDDLRAAFGKHHARAVHAKGIILEGMFQPSREASTLSNAAVFRAQSRVIVRFSDFTGIPDIPDNHPLASPRGFAIKFDPDGTTPVDIVAHGFNGFPTATSEEFGQLLLAIAASPAGSPEPSALSNFLAAHPIAATFLKTQKPMPVSYATNPYFGVNSFAFINANGRRKYVRYRFVPRAGEQYLATATATASDPNFLQVEIATRVRTTPIIFDWYAQVSGPGDKIDDPSVAWPDNRQLVKLGTITINQLSTDQQTIDRNLLFLPGKVPPGIEIADPMLQIRTNAYPISFGERQ